MKVDVKFVGSLRNAAHRTRLALELEDGVFLREAILRITSDVPELKRALIDPELDDPRPNTLILVNGKEISVLNGLDTLLRDGDEVVLVPVVHGG